MLPQNISRLPSMIGWPGGVGLALLGAAVVMGLTLSLPARNENASLAHEIRQLEPLLKQPASAVGAAEMRRRLDDFVGTLPQHDTINDTLNRLHDLAARHRLSLKNSEYRTEPNKTGAIRQLRITIKTEGEYADLRGFLREIPQALPALAIGQLSLTRQKISDTQLDTVVEFTLFYSNVYSQADPKRP
jgi:Tfp pilus assembly protein PilO